MEKENRANFYFRNSLSTRKWSQRENQRTTKVVLYIVECSQGITSCARGIKTVKFLTYDAGWGRQLFTVGAFHPSLLL